MKQYITTEQVNELSKEGREHLREWLWRPEMDGISRAVAWELSIGQMIEFLGNRFWQINCLDKEYYGLVQTEYEVVLTGPFEFQELELCDALWATVKEILEQEGK